MVDLLIARRLFQIIRFGRARPHNVPFAAVRAYDATSTRLKTVNHRVINVGRLSNLKAQSHVVHPEVVLCRQLHFLERTDKWRFIPIYYFQVAVALGHCR